MAACGNLSEGAVVGEDRHTEDSQISSFNDQVGPAIH